MKLTETKKALAAKNDEVRALSAHHVNRLEAERQIDLVAITTHWRRGLPRLIFGSVAQYLVSHIAIPVLMIAPKEDNN